LQGTSQDVGDYHGIGLGLGMLTGKFFWQKVVGLASVTGAVEARRFQRLGINVDANDLLYAELFGHQRQNAGAAAIIEYVGGRGIGIGFQPLHAQSRSGMAASAKGQTRVKLKNQGVRIRRIVPAWHDPDALANMNRIEL